jgi:hypothetical protein
VLADVTPLEKVVTLLEEVSDKVKAEGEEEAKTYNTFSCFCKDTSATTLDSITSGEDLKNNLASQLNEAMVARDAQDADIAAAQSAMSGLDGELEELRATRKSERLTYEQNEMDLTQAIEAIEAATQMLKASKTATSLAQLGPSAESTVRKALSMAAVLSPAKPGTKVASVLAQFEAADSPEYEAFSFHSDDIISTLEELLTDFQNKRNELDEAETAARQTFDTLVQDKEAIIAEKQKAFEDAKVGKAERQQEIATVSQDLTTTSSQLLVDKEYLQELTSTCNTKAVLWDHRSTTRANELGALEQAIALVNEAATGAPAAFIQLSQVRRSVSAAVAAPSSAGTSSNVLARRARAATLLRTRATALNSTVLMGVISEVSDDPFGKVKTLIQQLIERLLKQAQEEASHKGWCDEQIALAKQKRDYAAEAVKNLNGELAVGVARRAKLAELVDTLGTEIGELNATLANRTALREQETADNEAAIQTAEDGKAAVESAITILTQFYAAAANQASLLQSEPSSSSESSLVAVHRHVATQGNASIPDAGFDSNYTGAQSDSAGVIGMLDVIKSDFARAISETQKAEEDAKQEFLELETSAGKAKAEKEVALTERTRALADADAKGSEDNINLNSSSVQVNQAVNELLALKPACMESGVTSEEKKAQREAEIEALQEALNILESHVR